MLKTSAALFENMQRLRELTEHVEPYVKTVSKDKQEFKWESGGGHIETLYKSKDCSVAIAHVDKQSVHQFHFHEQREIIGILSGEAVVYLDDKVIEVKKYQVIVVEPFQKHQLFYPEDTTVLVMTLPATEDFPDVIRE